MSFNSTVNVKELTNEVEDLPRYDQIVINEVLIDFIFIFLNPTSHLYIFADINLKTIRK